MRSASRLLRISFVTWNSRALAQSIEDLTDRLEQLEQEIKGLSAQLGWEDFLIALGAAVVGGVIAAFATLVATSRTLKANEKASERMLQARRQELEQEWRSRQAEREAESRRRRLHILYGLSTEVWDNVASYSDTDWGLQSYVVFRSMWERAQDHIGYLPDEVVGALGSAYAQGAQLERLSGVRRSKDVVEDPLLDQQLRRRGEETRQSFEEAARVLGRWVELLSPPSEEERHWERGASDETN